MYMLKVSELVCLLFRPFSLRRYDAKADLWSVGTVLFEMVAGRPPFNGENHIDLLRNIQRKAVRLPPDVRVSKACVNLLRLLLNRNPLSRAGFKEFFEASDAFVALGCEGMASKEAGSCRVPKSNDLEAIPENDGASNSPTTSSDSIMTVEPTAQQQAAQQNKHDQPTIPQHPLQSQTAIPQPTQEGPATGTNMVSPPFTSSPTPASAALIPNTNLYDNRSYIPHPRNMLSPLTSSPPASGAFVSQSRNPMLIPSLAPGLPHAPGAAQNWHQHLPSSNNTGGGLTHGNSVSQSQTSTDDSDFVLVEHSTGTSRNDLYDASSTVTTRRSASNSAQHYYVTSPSPTLTSRNEYGNPSPGIPMEDRLRVPKGMLSTSPGTGKTLLGMVGRAAIGFAGGKGTDAAKANARLGDDVAAAAKMIATAEDIGRRAVSVAHLGDTRAYLGMRLLFKSTGEGSSLLSTAPMEGVEEEPSGNEDRENACGESASSDMMIQARRRSSTLSDKQMAEAIAEEDEQGEEMPFAISPEAPSVTLPSRASVSVFNRSTNMSSMRKSSMKPDPQTIRAHFGEALSCYLKALKMLKGALGASQRVASDLEDLESLIGRSPTEYDIPKMKRRCEVTSNWLGTQFRGVLERADAANVEISKLAISSPPCEEEKEETTTNVTSVEELIYNHALANGRDGAVKHLLGQFDSARSCYRSAGLLAETLLMESSVGVDDRKILEGYVDGFAARITELDQLMLQQSRMTGSSNVTTTRRGSSVVGLIGPPPAAPTTFLVGTPNSR